MCFDFGLANDGVPMIQASQFPATAKSTSPHVQVDVHVEVDVGGGSKRWRDYFAAAALTGYTANPKFSDTPHDELVQLAYEAADEMLQVRNGQNG